MNEDLAKFWIAAMLKQLNSANWNYTTAPGPEMICDRSSLFWQFDV